MKDAYLILVSKKRTYCCTRGNHVFYIQEFIVVVGWICACQSKSLFKTVNIDELL